MAFSTTILGKTVCGDKVIVYGTFANTAGSTGGDIDTGLKRVENLIPSHTGSSVVASAPVVNETFPLASAAVTIVTVADTSGTWTAFGIE